MNDKRNQHDDDVGFVFINIPSAIACIITLTAQNVCSNWSIENVLYNLLLKRFLFVENFTYILFL